MNESQLEVIPESTIEVMPDRAEIDVQISTAKKYPRSISAVKSAMLSFATLDEETAQGCFYSVPRGGKTIQGPSIRLAEIAISCYGNMRVESRIVSEDPSGQHPSVRISASAWDLERNTAVRIEKRRRITAKKDYKTGGTKPVDDDDINLAVNSGSAIALRDAVFKVIPLALIKPVCEQAKLVAIGNATTLATRRAKCIETFAKMGVGLDRILFKLEKEGAEDITLDDLGALIGYFQAIRDHESTIEEIFPEIPKMAVKETPENATTPGNVVPPEVPKRGPGRPKKTEPQPEVDAQLLMSKTPVKVPQDVFAEAMAKAGYTLDQLIYWAVDTGNFDQATADKVAAEGFAGMSALQAGRWLTRDGEIIKPILEALQMAKEAGK